MAKTIWRFVSLLTTYFLSYIKRFGDRRYKRSRLRRRAVRIAATIWASYPSFWPETIRARLVHAAEWTSPMRDEVNRAGTLRMRGEAGGGAISEGDLQAAASRRL